MKIENKQQNQHKVAKNRRLVVEVGVAGGKWIIYEVVPASSSLLLLLVSTHSSAFVTCAGTAVSSVFALSIGCFALICYLFLHTHTHMHTGISVWVCMLHFRFRFVRQLLRSRKVIYFICHCRCCCYCYCYCFYCCCCCSFAKIKEEIEFVAKIYVLKWKCCLPLLRQFPEGPEPHLTSVWAFWLVLIFHRAPLELTQGNASHTNQHQRP